MNKRILFICFLSFLCTSCSVDHTGLLPVISGDRHRVFCNFDYQVRNESESGEIETVSVSDRELDISVCSNGVPNRPLINDACRALQDRLRFMLSEDNDQVITVGLSGTPRTEPWRPDCSLPYEVTEGFGEVIYELSAPNADEYVLLNDETGQILGQTGLASIQADVTKSKIKVSAKFAAWRHANTTATGTVSIDTAGCRERSGCTLVLRRIELDIKDFTIVRPTGFAKDVHIRDAKLYSLKNYSTQMDETGLFQFSGVKVIVRGLLNGKQIQYLSEMETTVHGQFKDFIGDGLAGPKRIDLTIQERSDKFGILGTVELSVNRFKAKLRNIGANKCLRSAKNPNLVSPAILEPCSSDSKSQNWVFEKKGDYYQIKQLSTNTCLNLKTSTQDKEGGEVKIVGCSEHTDQLWGGLESGRVIHVAAGKCLDVFNRDTSKKSLTVYSCKDIPDQNWRLSL